MRSGQGGWLLAAALQRCGVLGTQHVACLPGVKRAAVLTPPAAPRAVAQIIPLLTELRSGNLVGNVEALTQVAAEAAADIQRLQVGRGGLGRSFGEWNCMEHAR